MLSTEERSGLWFTVIGGAVLVVALLVGIGYFTDPAAPELPTAAEEPARARASSPLKSGFARGRVVDARTGFSLTVYSIDVRGLEGVSDHWLDDPDPDVPGSFEVRGLPAGRDCTLVFAAEGYAPATRDVSIGSRREVELGDVELTPLVTLAGQLVDSTGAGVGPGQIEARTSAGVATVASDLHGNFRFDGLEPAEYALRATTEDGETSLDVREAAAADAGVRVDAVRGGERNGIEIAVFPSFTVRGAFRMPVGSAPLAGVAIPGVRGTVAGDGRFEVSGVRAGPLRLAALLDERRGVVFDVGAPFDGLELAVDPAQARELDAEFANPAGAPRIARVAPEKADAYSMLVVRVVDGAGAPLRGALVEVRSAPLDAPSGAPDAPSGPIATTWANLRGQCALRLDPGDYEVVARHGDRVGRRAESLSPDTTSETTIVAASAPPAPPAPPSDQR